MSAGGPGRYRTGSLDRRRRRRGGAACGQWRPSVGAPRPNRLL